MNQKQLAQYGVRAHIIKALAHPARLLIVDHLSRQPLCVRDLRNLVGSDLSTVSKHLSVLKHAGIVSHEKRSAQVFYTLRCTCVTTFLSCAEKVLTTTTRDQLRALKRT